MTKFYVDPDGNYLGGFDGATPPVGSVEVPNAPPDGGFTWKSGAWVAPEDYYKQERVVAYDKARITADALIFALWEKVVEGNSEKADALEIERKKIKEEYPKPP